MIEVELWLKVCNGTGQWQLDAGVKYQVKDPEGLLLPTVDK